MKQKHKVVALVLLLVGNVMAIYALRAQKANDVNNQNSDRFVSVADVLDELGKKFGYYFTLEETWDNGGVMNRIQSHRLERPAMGNDIWQDLALLTRLVPNMTYKVDDVNPKIIHIIDAGLAHRQGYALEENIDEINFSGSVFDLVKYLEKQGLRVSPRGAVDTHELSTIDFGTQVHVTGRQLSVRGALSDFIPLQGRSNRILWVARTKNGPNETSFVRFSFSPPPKSPSD
jgi:hypothetical protein